MQRIRKPPPSYQHSHPRDVLGQPIHDPTSTCPQSLGAHSQTAGSTLRGTHILTNMVSYTTFSPPPKLACALPIQPLPSPQPLATPNSFTLHSFLISECHMLGIIINSLGIILIAYYLSRCGRKKIKKLVFNMSPLSGWCEPCFFY